LVQQRLCRFEEAHAGVGKWPEHFRKKTQGASGRAGEDRAETGAVSAEPESGARPRRV